MNIKPIKILTCTHVYTRTCTLITTSNSTYIYSINTIMIEVSYIIIVGQEIICQSLLKLPDPSLVFTHHVSLLVWVYSQHTLTEVAKHWVSST